MELLNYYLSLVVNLEWTLQQLDIKNAFLNRVLDEEIFMTLSPAFCEKEQNVACKLNKSFYGLKQSPDCGLIDL